jgi:hypothetical protein
VLPAVTGHDLEVTAQGRLELTRVAQTVKVTHGALPIFSRQLVRVQARAWPVPFLMLSVTGCSALSCERYTGPSYIARVGDRVATSGVFGLAVGTSGSRGGGRWRRVEAPD